MRLTLRPLLRGRDALVATRRRTRRDAQRLPKALLLAALALLACNGGTCDGCGSCTLAPIRGGFERTERIPGAAQARVSRSGLAFLEANAATIVGSLLEDGLEFPIPRVEDDASIGIGDIEYTICKNSDCRIRGSIVRTEIDPVAPDGLRLRPTLNVVSLDAGGRRRGVPIELCVENPVPFGGDCITEIDCEADIDTRAGGREGLPLTATVRVEGDTRPGREGYAKLSVSPVTVDGDIEDEDIDVDCGSDFTNFFVDLFKGRLLEEIQNQVPELINDQLEDQLCQSRGPLGCAVGQAVPDESPDAICRFGASESSACVPILLGVEGQADLGEGLLGAISPGTHGFSQVLLAAGGPAEVVAEGLTLSMLGGFRSMDARFEASPGHASCVPPLEPPQIPTIPAAEALRGNTIPGTSEPFDVGLALSEAYLDVIGYGAFDSGMLCLGVGSRLSSQLSTGLFGLFVPSLGALAFPEARAPLAIVIRPQVPPDFTIGAGTADDPLLGISLPEFTADFYAFVDERYVRFMTFSADVSIPVDLAFEDGALVPSVGELSVTNEMVTNSELLTEPPEMLASTVRTVVAMFVGNILAGAGEIDLPEFAGLRLVVPDGGIVPVTQGDQRFLGVFTTLAPPEPSPVVAQTETELSLEPPTLEPKDTRLAAFAERTDPRLVATIRGTQGTAPLEYSARLDGMPWTTWSRSPRVTLTSPALRLEAKHVVEARARTIGSPRSVDPTPARATLLVDFTPPRLSVERERAAIRVTASDVVSDTDALSVRVVAAGRELVAWMPLPRDGIISIPERDAESLADGWMVEVRDEAGNVSKEDVGRHTVGLVRGIPRPGAGCDCAVTDRESAAGTASLFCLVFGWIVSRRRHPRGRSTPVRVASVSAMVLGLHGGGCDCSDGGGDGPSMTPDAGQPTTTCADVPCEGGLCCPSSLACVPFDLESVCGDPGLVCAAADAVAIDDECAVTCSRCEPRPSLPEGQLASHLDVARGDDGTLWISGYSPGAPPMRFYGDLVLGRLSPGAELVSWEILDGVPDGPITNDPDGYRGGVAAPGPDVGRYSSVVVRDDDVFVVAYDATAGALRLAHRSASGSVTTHVVDDELDAGRHASLALRGDGRLAVAYQVDGAAAASATGFLSRLRVAVATVTTPSETASWTKQDVHTAPVPCRAEDCSEGVCLETEGVCVVPDRTCDSECGDDEACVDGECRATVAEDAPVDHRPGTGLFAQLVPAGDGLALSFYDRTTGQLMGARAETTTFASPFVIDGYGRADPSTGDTGIGTSLFVDATGAWHLTYVDGTEEVLRYARVEGETVTREVVDDGYAVGGEPHADRKHLVGDDSSLVVMPDGELRVVYQDATAVVARVARRAAAEPFRTAVLDPEKGSGFWLEQVVEGTTSQAVELVRGAAGATEVRVVPLD